MYTLTRTHVTQLLEQALAVEEQLHRASNAGLVQDPNHSVMQLHSRYTDLDCLADGHVPLVAECLKHKKNSILLMKKGSILLFQLCVFIGESFFTINVYIISTFFVGKFNIIFPIKRIFKIFAALGRMEELLMEMKSDVSRLPGELSKIPSVSTQLKMDEISTISKAAHKETAPVIINNNSSGAGTNGRPGSVITHTHMPEVLTTTSIQSGTGMNSASVISDGLKHHSARSSSPRHSRRTAAAPTEEKVSIVAGNAVATAATAPVAYTTTGGTIQLPATAAAGTIQLPVTAAAGTIQLPATAGGTIQLPAGSLLQTADGIVVYQGVQSSGTTGAVAATAQKTATVVQQAPSGTQSSNNAQTYAIGVPTYMDGGSGAAVYLQGQTVQLVPVSGTQQVVYWPSVVQGGQGGTTTQAGAQIAVLSTDANGAPVITID